MLSKYVWLLLHNVHGLIAEWWFLQEVNSVYRILSAILNTGNIEFAAITSQHQMEKSEVPNFKALENGMSTFHCRIWLKLTVVQIQPLLFVFLNVGHSADCIKSEWDSISW